MANIASLDSIRKANEVAESDDSNRLYVGGASQQGGGSGLSVIAGDNAESANSFRNLIQQAQANANEGYE